MNLDYQFRVKVIQILLDYEPIGLSIFINKLTTQPVSQDQVGRVHVHALEMAHADNLLVVPPVHNGQRGHKDGGLAQCTLSLVLENIKLYVLRFTGTRGEGQNHHFKETMFYNTLPVPSFDR